MARSNAVIKISNQIAKANVKSTIIGSQFSYNFGETLTDKAYAYLRAFETVGVSTELAQWKKAYLLNQLYIEWAKAQPKKAKKSDFISYWNGGKSQLYNFLACGKWVKNDPETGDIIPPMDSNGVTFSFQAFVMVQALKDFEKYIADGTINATMTDTQIRETIKNIKSAVDVVDETETETESETESNGETETETDGETLDIKVYFNGDKVELTAEQKALIKAIIEG